MGASGVEALRRHMVSKEAAAEVVEEERQVLLARASYQARRHDVLSSGEAYGGREYSRGSENLSHDGVLS